MTNYDNYKNIVVFGAGTSSIPILEYFTANVRVGLMVCDNDPKKHNTKHCGFDVTTVEDAVKRFPEALYILTSTVLTNTMRKQLIRLGVSQNNITTLDESKFHKKSYIRSIDIIVSSHCNLACYGCGAYSPLERKPVFYDFEYFKKDISRISEVLSQKISNINLTGGETLLNPRICEYIAHTRDVFPDSAISILTNGTLINRMPEDFFVCMQKNNAICRITVYPININRNDIIDLLERYSVNYSLAGLDSKLKESENYALDEKGGSDVRYSFGICPFASNCATLEPGGKLYQCGTAARSYLLNSYFGTHFELDDADYIDIYKAQSGDEILEFLANPIPFCKYCNFESSFSIPWSISKRELSEWVRIRI